MDILKLGWERDKGYCKCGFSGNLPLIKKKYNPPIHPYSRGKCAYHGKGQKSTKKFRQARRAPPAVLRMRRGSVTRLLAIISARAKLKGSVRCEHRQYYSSTVFGATIIEMEIWLMFLIVAVVSFIYIVCR